MFCPITIRVFKLVQEAIKIRNSLHYYIFNLPTHSFAAKR